MAKARFCHRVRIIDAVKPPTDENLGLTTIFRERGPQRSAARRREGKSSASRLGGAAPSPLKNRTVTCRESTMNAVDLHSTRRRPSGGRKRETATSPIQSNDTDPKSQTCGRGEIRHCTEAESYFILHVLRHNTPAVHTHPPKWYPFISLERAASMQ